MDNCPLCERQRRIVGWFWITLCQNCYQPMLVSSEHKPEFSEQEKEDIKKLFPNSEVRFEQRKIKNHAHCHIYERK